jgi:hypothetical protein
MTGKRRKPLAKLDLPPYCDWSFGRWGDDSQRSDNRRRDQGDNHRKDLLESGWPDLRDVAERQAGESKIFLHITPEAVARSKIEIYFANEFKMAGSAPDAAGWRTIAQILADRHVGGLVHGWRKIAQILADDHGEDAPEFLRSPMAMWTLLILAGERSARAKWCNIAVCIATTYADGMVIGPPPSDPNGKTERVVRQNRFVEDYLSHNYNEATACRNAAERDLALVWDSYKDSDFELTKRPPATKTGKTNEIGSLTKTITRRRRGDRRKGRPSEKLRAFAFAEGNLRIIRTLFTGTRPTPEGSPGEDIPTTAVDHGADNATGQGSQAQHHQHIRDCRAYLLQVALKIQ